MRLRRGMILALAMATVTVGAAVASSLPNQVGLSTIGGPWRGTMERADLAALVRELGSPHASGGSDLLVIRARLAENSGTTTTTGWHGHTGPSIVVVTAGTMIVRQAAPSGGCTTATYGSGEAFFHTEGAHSFENHTGSPVEFLVAYFVPTTPTSVITHPSTPIC